MKKRALISVSDKAGVVEFAKGLEQLGYEVVSTGGTATILRQGGVAVINVSDITGFPECLDGRVKTLHPSIHGGILAVRKNPVHMAEMERLDIGMIDVVAINLYPFKETISKRGVVLEDAIEQIDIGGPTMIRAAAKNWQDVVVVVDPGDYEYVLGRLASGEMDNDDKYDLACKVFEHTSAYDALVASYLRRQQDNTPLFPHMLTLTYEKVQSMRYGENPHQRGAFYREMLASDNGIGAAQQLHGKEMSYNNISDANGALDVIKEFSVVRPCCVAVKHANPCGVAQGETLLEAYTKAFDSDPVSIYGGIVAVNREVDEETARKMSETFLEIVIAPSFDQAALDILTQKKNLRLLELTELQKPNYYSMLDMKKVAGGILVQELDTELYNELDLEVVTQRTPTPQEMAQLLFAWRVVKHVKSNGICLVKDGQTVGIGPGQTNRVTALDLAIRYAGPQRAQGSVMGSDAFFPFRDCVDAAQKAGVTAIIQPGGSVRDAESIEACDQAGIAMVFTKMRHFKH